MSQGKTQQGAVPRLGVVAKVGSGDISDSTIKHVHDLGLPTCQIFYEQLSLAEAPGLLQALEKYGVEVSAVSEHNPGPRVFDFYQGPLTIGIIPEKYRRPRIDALKLAADFALACNIPSIHTHVGFIPEDPNDPIYPGAVAAVKEVAQHCKDRKNAAVGDRRGDAACDVEDDSGRGHGQRLRQSRSRKPADVRQG